MLGVTNKGVRRHGLVAVLATVISLEVRAALLTDFAMSAELDVKGYAASETLENFPVLVRVSPERLVGFDYADLRAEGMPDITFTIDGQVTCTTDLKGLGKDGKVKSQGVPQVPGYIKLSVEAAPWAGPNGGGWEKDMPEEDEVLIDWVRVWQK